MRRSALSVGGSGTGRMKKNPIIIAMAASIQRRRSNENISPAKSESGRAGNREAGGEDRLPNLHGSGLFRGTTFSSSSDRSGAIQWLGQVSRVSSLCSILVFRD